MPTMSDVDPAILYTLLKGEPGLRKSTQALSYPRPQYWFSHDKKMSALLLPIHAWGINKADINFDNYDGFDKAEPKLKQFRVNCPYKTIIIDSVTSLCDLTLGQAIKSKLGQKNKEGGESGRSIGGISVNVLEDFNAESSALQQLIEITKDINEYHKVNIILIAHVIQAEYRNTTNNTTHISRQLVTAAKKNAAKIPAYTGEVYHFNLEKGFEASSDGRYSLLTTHTGDDFARTALPLDKKIVFDDKPIYKTYIEPAIIKLKEERLVDQVKSF